MMHSTLGVGNAAGAEGWMHYLVQFAKPFRMPDFFLISGLFLRLVIDRPGADTSTARLSFLYFYVLWLSIQFAFKAPGWMAEGKTPGELASFFAMSFIEPFGTLWFIYMLPGILRGDPSAERFPLGAGSGCGGGAGMLHQRMAADA
ncbi:MAG: hypothetical protein R3D29_02500 [Nitratireductor sp.]